MVCVEKSSQLNLHSDFFKIMRLFKLTLATIFRRKAWAICLFCVLVLPFALPMISSATEKPLLVQPARIQAAWGTLFVCTMGWGFFAAARPGGVERQLGSWRIFPHHGYVIHPPAL